MRKIEVGTKVSVRFSPPGIGDLWAFWTHPAIVREFDGSMVLVEYPVNLFRWFYRSEVKAVPTRFRFPQSAT